MNRITSAGVAYRSHCICFLYRHPNLLMNGCVGNSTTIQQLHSIINICRNVGRRPDRVEAVRLAAQNRPANWETAHLRHVSPPRVSHTPWMKQRSESHRQVFTSPRLVTTCDQTISHREVEMEALDWSDGLPERRRNKCFSPPPLHLVWKGSVFLLLVDRRWLDLCAF